MERSGARKVVAPFVFLRSRMPHPTYNLLDLRPRRTREWEEVDGRVVVLMPKFRHPLLARWLLPMLRSQNFRIKLDGLGSAVWKRCDGETSVALIAEQVRAEFGEAAEPVHDRIGTFLRKLEHGELVLIPPPGDEPQTTQTKKEE